MQRTGAWTLLDKEIASQISKKVAKLSDPRIDGPLCISDKRILYSELRVHLAWLDTRIEQALESQSRNVPIAEQDMSHEVILQVLEALKEGVEEVLKDAITRVKKP